MDAVAAQPPKKSQEHAEGHGPAREVSGERAPAAAGKDKPRQRRKEGQTAQSKGAGAKDKPAPTASSAGGGASSTTTTRKSKNKDRAERSGDGGVEDAAGKVKLKVVVRRLPPNVPEAVFWKAISAWVTRPGSLEDGSNSGGANDGRANIDHAYFVQGKLKDGSRRGVTAESGVSPHVYSRAYLRFKTFESLLDFHRGFDGHLFKDAKGNEYVALVEFAPFQRIPSDLARRRKADPRQGTIEEDPDYQKFVASLEQKREEEVHGQTQSEKTDAQLMGLVSQAASTSSNAERAKSTPLLDHLRAQKTARAESSALKNARNYLNRSNNAYAAASASPRGGGGAEKGKERGKGKGKGKGKTEGDSLIPTGPKASRKAEDKGQKKQQQAQPQPRAREHSNTALAIPTGPSASQRGSAKAAKGQAGRGPSKAGQADGQSEPTLNSLAKGEREGSASQAVAVPSAPASDRGARGARGRGGRGGRGRGGGGGGATRAAGAGIGGGAGGEAASGGGREGT